MIQLENLIKKLDKIIGFVSTPDPHTAQLTGYKLLRDFLSTRSTTDFLLQRERDIYNFWPLIKIDIFFHNSLSLMNKIAILGLIFIV